MQFINPKQMILIYFANISFGKDIQTREERAEALSNMEQKFLSTFTEGQKNVLNNLLLYYMVNGVSELNKTNVFKLFLPKGVTSANSIFESSTKLKLALSELQKKLYNR